MSNKGLELWRDTVTEYYSKKGETYKVPKKNSADYAAIRKIYDSKKSGKTEEVKPKKSCTCRCKCDCPKPK